jgi:glycosyltransferase involved in cell wall biosynthesis
LPSLSVLLPALDEVESLDRTLRALLALGRPPLEQILILLHPQRTGAATREVAERHRRQAPEVIEIVAQSRPLVGGAYRDGIERVRGEWTLLLASDEETDPALVPQLLERMAGGNFDVVTASRWLPGGGFAGYGRLKRWLNFVFQRAIARLYGTSLSDLTFGYRLFRSSWLKRIDWQELSHPFFLETALKPLRLGATFGEVPTRWRPRPEGRSVNSFRLMASYLPRALRWRWENPQRWLRKEGP